MIGVGVAKNCPVQIEWIDSRGVTSQWEFIDGMEPLLPVYCVSVGFLIEETKEYKTLAMTTGGDQLFGRLTIPVAAIKRVKRLRA